MKLNVWHENKSNGIDNTIFLYNTVIDNTYVGSTFQLQN